MTAAVAVARILLAHAGGEHIIVRLQLQVACATFRFAAQFWVTRFMAGRMSRGVVGSAILATAMATTGCVGEAEESEDRTTGATVGDQQRATAAVPDKDSFSLSFENLSLGQGLTTDGITNKVTVRLADNLNNALIPDNTQVFFTTNSGSIDAFCYTEDGACSVTWTSQGERPGAGPAADDPTANPPDPLCSSLPNLQTVSCPRPHRVKVLAWVEGQESFTDLNANGLFDDADSFVTSGPNPDDLPEPFRDDNENGVRDSAEVFVDYPLGISTQVGSSASYDQADGLYSGPDCAHSTLCAAEQSLFVFGNGTFALPDGRLVADFTDCNGNRLNSLNVTTGGSATFCWIAADAFGNPPPSGTTVSYAAESMDQVVGPETLPNTSQVSRQQVTLVSDGDAGPGTLELTLTPPEGNESKVFIPIAD
jgi:hypothetical protein